MLTRHLAGLYKSAHQSTVLSLMEPGSLADKVSRSSETVQTLGIEQGRLPFSKLPGLRRVFKDEKPDLVHGWMYHGNIAASVGQLITFQKKPVIWSIHHTLYDPMAEKPMTRSLIRLSARLSNRTRAIAYCSRVSADQHEAIGFNSRNRVIIYNGIDCDEFKPDLNARPHLAKLLNIPEQRRVIGSVGRYHPMKNQIQLVHAVAELLRDGYDIQGLFIGADHEEGIVRKLARELGIDDRISTLGIETDVSAVMPGLEFHAMTSSWGETFSLATAEAMASCVPAVVTEVGDCPWVVGDTGISIPRNNLEALVAALRSFLDMNADARQNLGNKARQRVIENFSLQQYLSKYLALYDEALHPGSGLV
jgi:glycosyltransferase involved in cell wall biosynthesis